MIWSFAFAKVEWSSVDITEHVAVAVAAALWLLYSHWGKNYLQLQKHNIREFAFN